jgi:hypothetical protein
MSQHIIGTINIAKPEWAPEQWVYILVAYALIAAASVPLLMVGFHSFESPDPAPMAHLSHHVSSRFSSRPTSS